jgi:transcriptional regulator with XRE-family HTH domain
MKTKMPLLTDEAIQKHVGERVKQLRLRKNLTQDQLAKDSGVGKSTIERFEKGHSIQLNSFIRILRSVGKLDELIDLIPDQTASPMEMLMREEPTKYRVSRVNKEKNPSAWKWGDE